MGVVGDGFAARGSVLEGDIVVCLGRILCLASACANQYVIWLVEAIKLHG